MRDGNVCSGRATSTSGRGGMALGTPQREGVGHNYVSTEGLTPPVRLRARLARGRRLDVGRPLHPARPHDFSSDFAAQRNGVRATIVMPETAPISKQRRTEQYGAEVV
jgi:hypothetical protein